MKRKIEAFLHKWKDNILRRPLIIFGAPQIGKTNSVLSFGNKEYKNTIYFNSDNNKNLLNIFLKEKSIDKIILNLSLLSGETILKDDTLIIIDNLADIEIIKGLKLFGSNRNSYHIIGITSHRELISSTVLEDLQFKSMTEMDFEEFLWAHDEKNLANLIKESFEKHKACPFHKVILDLFHEYLLTGGLPEIVSASLAGKSSAEIDTYKQKIIAIYKSKFLENSNLIDISRTLEVFKSLPEQLIKDNKKFQYGLMGIGKRAKEYDSAINYLTNSQLVYRSYKITTVSSPLSSCREKDSFKLYLCDDGILASLMHANSKSIVSSEKLKETLYENSIARTLAENGYSLYYYQSDGKAEVDFVIQNRHGKIIPIEIATKSMSKAKSLAVFTKKFAAIESYRITENNFSSKKDVRYIPIYAIFCLNDNII